MSSVIKHEHDKSIVNIKQFMESEKGQNEFNFSKVDMNTVKLYLSELKANKATGYDMLPSKLLKTASDILCQSVCYLINMSIKVCCFPNKLKFAEITPLRKVILKMFPTIGLSVYCLVYPKYIKRLWSINCLFILKVYLVK